MMHLVLPVEFARPGRLLSALRRGVLAGCVAGFAAFSQLLLAADSAVTESAHLGDDSVTTSDEASSLIESMTHALRSLTYEGIFVHAQGLNLTTLHILHANSSDGELERLSALNGEAREVFRNNSLVTCIWPDSQSVVVSKSRPRELLSRVDASLAANPNYTFSMGGIDRVAGRTTRIVNVISRDEYRYGYRFWIDTDTSMLLRSMLLENAGLPIEQIIFTHIDFPDTIDLSRFDIISLSERRELVGWLEPKRASAAASLIEPISEASDRVSFRALPAGYRKVSETLSSFSSEDEPMSHVTISDGMASVSVYVEYIREGGQTEHVTGLSRMGALNAYGIRTRAALITAVGDVPEATVRAIATAVVLTP